MASYLPIDVSKVFGINKSTISRHISKGNLILDKDGRIDDKNIQNKKLLAKWHSKLKAKKPEKAQMIVSDFSEAEELERYQIPPTVQPSSDDSLETRKLKAEVAYKEEQVLKTQLQNAKLRGESIPFSIADGLIKSIAHHLQSQFKIAANNILTEIAHKTKMNLDTETKFKNRLITEINRAHMTGLKNLEKEIRSLMNDIAVDFDENETE